MQFMLKCQWCQESESETLLCDSRISGGSTRLAPQSITPEDAKREDASTRAGADEITGRRIQGTAIEQKSLVMVL